MRVLQVRFALLSEYFPSGLTFGLLTPLSQVSASARRHE